VKLLLWRKSRKNVLITAFLCSLAIELCQLPQARGTDIDDIWLNTLGAFIGYTVWRLLDKKLPSFCGKFMAGGRQDKRN